jgi:hypothetical protein
MIPTAATNTPECRGPAAWRDTTPKRWRSRPRYASLWRRCVTATCRPAWVACCYRRSGCLTRIVNLPLAIGRARSGVGWEDITPYVGEEARHVWEIYESDRMREFYLRVDDRPGVVLGFECDDLAEAERLFAARPVLEGGLLDFEVIPAKKPCAPARRRPTSCAASRLLCATYR